MFMLYMW